MPLLIPRVSSPGKCISSKVAVDLATRMRMSIFYYKGKIWNVTSLLATSYKCFSHKKFHISLHIFPVVWKGALSTECLKIKKWEIWYWFSLIPSFGALITWAGLMYQIFNIVSYYSEWCRRIWKSRCIPSSFLLAFCFCSVFSVLVSCGISNTHCLFYLFFVNAKPETEQNGNQSQSLFEYSSMFLITHILKRERTAHSLVFGMMNA